MLYSMALCMSVMDGRDEGGGMPLVGAENQSGGSLMLKGSFPSYEFTKKVFRFSLQQNLKHYLKH